MNYSEVNQRIRGRETRWGEFTVLLADLDRNPSDGIDVILSPLGAVQVDTQGQRIILHSAATRPVSDGMPVALFEMFLGRWPMAGVLDGDYAVVVAMPLEAPEDSSREPTLVPLAGIHVGETAQEIWLLASPIEEFPTDQLPS